MWIIFSYEISFIKGSKQNYESRKSKSIELYKTNFSGGRRNLLFHLEERDYSNSMTKKLFKSFAWHSYFYFLNT